LSTVVTSRPATAADQGGRRLVDVKRDGSLDGMQDFDAVIEKLIRDGVLRIDTGLGYSTNPGNLRLTLSDYIEAQASESEFSTSLSS
jgi:twitching motility protein PilT